MKTLFLILFLFSYLPAQNKFDSVLESMKNKPDSAQITVLNNFCWRYRNIDPALAIKAGELALKLCDESNNKAGKSKTLGYLSTIYRDRGDYQKAMNLTLESLDLSIAGTDWKQTGYAYNNMASIYRLMGNYPLALETNYKGLKIFDEHNFLEGIAFCKYNIGLIYLRQANFKKALEYFEKTVSIRKKIGDKNGEAKALSRIAELYVEWENYSRAISIYNEVESVYNDINDVKSLMTVWMGRALVFEKLNDFNGALAESKKALANANSFNDAEGVIRNNCVIGLLYAKQGKYDEGLKCFNKIKDMALNSSSSFLRLNFLESISKFYSYEKDYNNAYKYLSMYNLFKDSIEQRQKNSVIAEVEASYLTNKQVKEKELIQNDLEHQKKLMIYWIVILFVFLIVIVVIVFLYNAQRKANAIKDKLFGIIAHDLKNPFSILMNASQILTDKEWQITQQERDQYLEMIASSSKKTYTLLDNLLFWSRTQIKKISLNPKVIDLYEVLLNTIDLANDQAINKNILIENKVLPACNIFADEEVIKLVVRNLITNAIKFSNPGGVIIINAYRENSKCVVLVEDNGIGIPKEKLDKIFDLGNQKISFGTKGEKGTGLGLLICKEFIENSGGKIWVISEVNKGTKFFFTIPVLKDSDKTSE